MNRPAIGLNVFFILLGVAGLMLKRHYSGPFTEAVYSYGGNVAASLAVYFLVGIRAPGWRYKRLVTAGIALLVVELFEATDGFGVMANVYDPVDFVANALGVGVAVAIDTAATSINTARSHRFQ